MPNYFVSLFQRPGITLTLRNNLSDFPKFLKANWSSILMFTVLVVLTHLDGNIAMLVGFITFIWAVILMIRMFVGLSSKRDPEKIKHFKKSGLRFLYMAILSVVSWQGISYIHQRIDRNFQPFINGLEAYKTNHGEYPKGINRLSTRLDNEALYQITDPLPKCGILINFPPYPYYYLRHDKDAFSILCMTYGFNHHTYSSKSKRWDDWD